MCPKLSMLEQDVLQPPGLPGPSTFLTLRVEFRFCSISSSAVHRLARWPPMVHGAARGPCSISIRFKNGQRVEEEMLQNLSTLTERR